MVIWWILSILLILIFIILLLRVGVYITFGQTLCVKVKIGPITLQIVPAPEKISKKASEKSRKNESKEKQIRPTTQDILQALPIFWAALKKALKKTRRSIRINPFQLRVIFGGDDPSQVSQLYGWANAVMWTVMPQFERLLCIPDPHIHLEPDFEEDRIRLEGSVGISFHLIALLSITLAMGIPIIRWYTDWQKAHTYIKEQSRAAQTV